MQLIHFASRLLMREHRLTMWGRPVGMGLRRAILVVTLLVSRRQRLVNALYSFMNAAEARVEESPNRPEKRSCDCRPSTRLIVRRGIL